MIGRIGASVSGIELTLLNRLASAQANITLSTLREASGMKINSPSDDPAGFVRLGQLQSQYAQVTATLPNVTAASDTVSQTQLVLDQIRTQVNTIHDKALADVDQALSSSQRAANQAAIDNAVAEINRLASTTINGRKVLDGSADFTYSGVNAAQVADVQTTSLGPNVSKTISGTVTVAATQGSLTHNEGTGLITNDATLVLTGNRGSAEISVTTGDALSDVAAQINRASYLTGVTATVTGGVNLVLKSIDYGSAGTASIDVTSGTFATTGTGIGTNATATINGRALTGVGNHFDLQDNGFTASVEFAGGFSGAFSTITVSGDGLTFALSPDVTRRSTLALPGVQAARLGGASGTLADLTSGATYGGLGTNASQAVRIADEALGQLTVIEGQVDGFADETIASSSALLDGVQEQLSKSIDQLNKTDDAEGELRIVKNQALASNALAGLAILSQQRQSIVALIQQIAGLS